MNDTFVPIVVYIMTFIQDDYTIHLKIVKLINCIINVNDNTKIMQKECFLRNKFQAGLLFFFVLCVLCFTYTLYMPPKFKIQNPKLICASQMHKFGNPSIGSPKFS